MWAVFLYYVAGLCYVWFTNCTIAVWACALVIVQWIYGRKSISAPSCVISSISTSSSSVVFVVVVVILIFIIIIIISSCSSIFIIISINITRKVSSFGDIWFGCWFMNLTFPSLSAYRQRMLQSGRSGSALSQRNSRWSGRIANCAHRCQILRSSCSVSTR